MILIVGSKGNMGSRYGAILNHLGVSWQGADIETGAAGTEVLAKQADGIIIASPTGLHYEHLRTFASLKKPIFCEKPFTKNMNEMGEICELYEGQSLTMALQYSELLEQGFRGESFYNYFKHGVDGLVWDCIQIIGLAKGECALREDSPIWRCRINGQTLSQGHMDEAYVKNVQRWLGGNRHDPSYLYDLHQKTSEYEDSIA